MKPAKPRKKRKPHALTRAAHDWYSGIASRLLPPIEFATDPAHIGAAEVTPLYSSGERELEHPIEAALYGPKYACTTVRWTELPFVRLRDVVVVGDQGYVFLPDGRVLGICPSQREQLPRKIRRPIRPLARRFERPLFHLTGRNHENHGHFILDLLPRWFAAREKVAGSGCQVLVAPGHGRWQSRYLQLLGVDPGDVVEGSPGTDSVRELLFVPHTGGEKGLCNPNLLEAMLAELQSSMAKRGWIGKPIPDRERRVALWISRRDALQRGLQNEEELIEAARPILGEIEVQALAKTPFEDQVRALNRAWCVIGAKGQGLTNIVFGRGKLFVILQEGELNSGWGWDANYRDIGLLAGNRSVRLFSETPLDARMNWTYERGKFEKELRRVVEEAGGRERLNAEG
jgi:capsular polysaccharide biosynthesis protein